MSGQRVGPSVCPYASSCRPFQPCHPLASANLAMMDYQNVKNQLTCRFPTLENKKLEGCYSSRSMKRRHWHIVIFSEISQFSFYVLDRPL